MSNIFDDINYVYFFAKRKQNNKIKDKLAEKHYQICAFIYDSLETARKFNELREKLKELKIQ